MPRSSIFACYFDCCGLYVSTEYVLSTCVDCTCACGIFWSCWEGLAMGRMMKKVGLGGGVVLGRQNPVGARGSVAACCLVSYLLTGCWVLPVFTFLIQRCFLQLQCLNFMLFHYFSVYFKVSYNLQLNFLISSLGYFL